MKKRLLAFLMCTALVVGSCVPVMATETIEEIVEAEEVIGEEDTAEEIEIEILDEDVVSAEADELIVEDEEVIDEDAVAEEEIADTETADAEITEEIAEEDCATQIVKSFSLDGKNFHDDLRDMIAMAEEVDGVMSEMTSRACLKRLILYVGYDSLKSDYNAINAASDGEMTVLQYATEKATTEAYNAYAKQYGTDKVFYDHIEKIDDQEIADYEENIEAIEDAIVASEEVDANDTPEYFAKLMGATTFKGNMSSTMKSKQIIVADLDTGLNTSHEKIKGKYVKGYSYYNNGSYVDDNNHGTMTASCVLGVTSGTKVKIMPIKVMDSSGSGYASDITAGIKWAYEHGAKVINMSLGGNHYCEGYKCGCYGENIDAAYKKNVTIVVSAGNSNLDIDYYGVHPAEFRKCITVAATDKNLEKAYFSNYGDAVDVTSYGVDIYMPTYYGPKSYSTASGTSFSCPLTAGAVALLYESGVATKPADCSKVLRNKAKDLGTKGWDKYYGAGTVRIGGIKVAGKIGWSSDTAKLTVGTTKSGLFSNPNKAKVTFTSDNKKVVTVSSSGTLTAKGVGTAMVTAKSGGKSYYCKVTVIKPRIKGAGSVKVKKTTTFMFVDGKGTTKWYSTNKAIATVSSKGVVKGVKKGTVNIVAINNGTAYIKKITVK